MVAIILSRLVANKAKEVLAIFHSDEQKDILFRMAQGTQVPQEILNVVVNALEEKIRVFDEKKGEIIGGSDKLAEILKHMKASEGEKILSGLKDRNMGLASRIQDKMVTFSDIAKANDRGIRTALVEIDTRLLALSLKKTDKSVKDKIVKNISKNRLAILKEELTALGPRRLSEIKAAQNEVISILRKYAEKGIIVFREDKDEWV